MKDVNVVFVLGLPGAGKGTQCSLLVEKFGCGHLSAGDLLRQVRDDPDSPFCQQVTQHLREGSLVPSPYLVGIFIDKIQKLTKDRSPPLILIDGFPRSLDNYNAWIDGAAGKTNLKGVLLFDGPSEIFLERCLKREGRPEDNITTLKNRIANFYAQSTVVIDFFNERNLLHRIDTNGEKTEIFKKVEKTLISMNAL